MGMHGVRSGRQALRACSRPLTSERAWHAVGHAARARRSSLWSADLAWAHGRQANDCVHGLCRMDVTAMRCAWATYACGGMQHAHADPASGWLIWHGHAWQAIVDVGMCTRTHTRTHAWDTYANSRTSSGIGTCEYYCSSARFEACRRRLTSGLKHWRHWAVGGQARQLPFQRWREPAHPGVVDGLGEAMQGYGSLPEQSFARVGPSHVGWCEPPPLRRCSTHPITHT
jgi:hypothetical protein